MATIRDLAKYTGFSVATISRVLNNDATMKVMDSTRIAILEAADELKYSLPESRRIKQGSAYHIAIAEMMSQKGKMDDPYYLYLQNYVVRACVEQGCTVSYLSDKDGGFGSVECKGVDGILAIGIFSEEQIAQLSKISRSIVFVDSSPDEQKFCSVVLNFKQGVQLALNYLIQSGHCKIGFLGPTHKLDQKKRRALEVRRQYFKEYMMQTGHYDERWMIDTMLTLEETKMQVEKWVKSGEEWPTAFLAYNEGTAITAVSVFQEAGIQIPEELSIISFNDTPLAIFIEPSLTSINAHLDMMGQEAVRLMKERLEKQDSLPCKIVLPLTLTERSSVAKCTPCVL